MYLTYSYSLFKKSFYNNFTILHRFFKVIFKKNYIKYSKSMCAFNKECTLSLKKLIKRIKDFE